MSIESQRDLDALKRTGRVVAAVLAELRSSVRAGVTTAELDGRCAELLRQHGARAAPKHAYGFPGALCISVNDEVVHGVPGPRVIRAGDLVKLDLVAELEGYFADSAVTVAVPPVTPASRNLVHCVRRAFERALDVVQAGRRVCDVGRVIEREVRRSGLRVVPELGGHGVGRAIHEEPGVPNYADPNATSVLTDGLVLAIEPIVCAGSGKIFEASDGWTIRTLDGSRAAHHEHTLVVTRSRPIVVTTL